MEILCSFSSQQVFCFWSLFRTMDIFDNQSIIQHLEALLDSEDASEMNDSLASLRSYVHYKDNSFSLDVSKDSELHFKQHMLSNSSTYFLNNVNLFICIFVMAKVVCIISGWLFFSAILRIRVLWFRISEHFIQLQQAFTS